MRIGIVTTWFERGAAYVSRQYRNVLASQHEVFIYVRGGEDIVLQDNFWSVPNLTIGKCSKYTTRTKIDLNDFRNWLLSNKIEVVIFNEQQEWAPLKVCHELGITTGAYVDYYKKETIDFFAAYDFLLCNTKRHLSVFEWHSQYLYIPWGTEVNLFKPVKSGHIQNGKLILFHSAGMNPQRKGTDFLIKAIHSIGDKRLKTIIHTQVKLDEFFPELKSTLNTLLKSGKLEIVNKTVPAPGLYHTADIYVYPTRLEGIGLSIAEASACGLPVITTNYPPMNEFINDNKNGRLIAVREEVMRGDHYYWPQAIIDLQDLIQKIDWYLDNYDQIPYLKTRCRAIAESKLNWEKNASELPDLIRKMEFSNIDEKKKAIEQALEYDRKRPIKYYVNTFLPYVKLKRKIKKILRSG